MDIIFLKLLNMGIAAGWLIVAVTVLRFFMKRVPRRILCVLWALVAIRLSCPFSLESSFSLIPRAEAIQLTDNTALGNGVFSFISRLLGNHVYENDSYSNELYANGTDANESYKKDISQIDDYANESHTNNNFMENPYSNGLNAANSQTYDSHVNGLYANDLADTLYADGLNANDSFDTNPYANAPDAADLPTDNTFAGSISAPAQYIDLPHTLLPIASLIWRVGICVLLAYALVSYLQVRRSVREAVPLQAQVWLCDAVRSPFILGFFRPRIYLPSDISQEQLPHVLAHEQAHLRRRDHWWKLLGFLLLAIYWFQPLVWLAYVLFCRDMELACDEKVIRDMTIAQKKAYASALVSCSVRRPSLTASPLAFGEVGVKERVKRILHYKKPAFWIAAAAAIACIAVAVCFLTTPRSDVYDIKIAIPAGGGQPVYYSDMEISPTKDFIVLSSGEGLGDTMVSLVPVEAKTETAYDEPTYMTPGLSVKMNAEKGAWFQVGVSCGGLADRDIEVYVHVENVNVRIASSDTNTNTAGKIQYMGQWYDRASLSAETLTWLEWFNSLSVEEQLAVDYEPYDLHTSNSATDTMDAESENHPTDDTASSAAENKELLPESSTQQPDSLEAAINAAILAENTSSYPSEYDFVCCDYVPLATLSATPLAGNTTHIITCYGWALYEKYNISAAGIENVGGSHIPVALTFTLNENGYQLQEYWEPRDGSYYVDDIREKFPSDTVDDALDSQKYIVQQTQSCYRQAVEANEIDTDTVISNLLDSMCSPLIASSQMYPTGGNTDSQNEISQQIQETYRQMRETGGLDKDTAIQDLPDTLPLNPGISSNPQDYVDPVKYRELVYYGEYTLRYCLNRFFDGGETGLEGHIMAHVCETLLQTEDQLPLNAADAATGQLWFDTLLAHGSNIVLPYLNAENAEKEYFSNVEEKRQFTEIMTASGEMIGIIDNNKEIERFVKQLDIESWNDMEQLPEDIDLVYRYISYEVIDEPIFLPDGIPLVHMSTLELYISDKGEYIIRDYDQEIETIARISEEAGRFLNAPEDLALNKNITAKDILDGWGLDFYVPASDIESDIKKTVDSENARYYEGDTSFTEQARYYEGVTSFTEQELLRTSKEQKIQFYGADKNTLPNEIDDISKIAQYLNGLDLSQWKYADNAPNPEEVECHIVRLMLSRDNKKELKEMDTQILYKSDGTYYIEEIIPGDYSDRGDFITYYQVSEETANYILSYLERIQSD